MAYNNSNNNNAFPSSSHPSPTLPSPHAMFNPQYTMSPREAQEEENRRVSSSSSAFFPPALDPMPAYSTQPLPQQHRESEIPFPPVDQQQHQQHHSQHHQSQHQERDYNVHHVGSTAESTSRPRASGSVRTQPYNVARRPQSSLGRVSGRARLDLSLPERSLSYPSR